MAVDDTIAKTFKDKPDIVSYLIGHGKKETMIDNLCREISLANLQNNITLKADNIKFIVTDFTKMFAHAALTQKEQEIMASRKSEVNELLKK